MKNKALQILLGTFFGVVTGTAVGAALSEYFSFDGLLASLVLSPLIIAVRAVSTITFALAPHRLVHWISATEQNIALTSLFASTAFCIAYSISGKKWKMVAFSLSFAVFNLGNFELFTAWMSI